MSDLICLLNDGKIEQLGTPVSVYTEPKKKFAANFIGNYNVYEQEVFQKLTGEQAAFNCPVAIRPEVIGIYRERPATENSYIFPAIVKESRSRGNVLRYMMDVNGVPVFADTLFRSFSMYEDGAEVWLSVEKRNCLEVREETA